MFKDLKIGFIGGGNMARAIAQGIFNKGVIDCSSQVIVSARSEDTLDDWKGLNVQTTLCNSEVVEKSDIIFLAVKPNQLESALKCVKLKGYLRSKLYVSVLAGVPSDVIMNKLHEFVTNEYNEVFVGRLIRVMPNTLALIGEGCSAIAPHSSAESNDIELVQKIFGALGRCEIVPEYLLSAITGLSGSGPAYIYMVIEALSDGGVKQGLPRAMANTFAAQTVLGAAKMVLETKKHTSQLKDEVCSPGGTTIHAVHALEAGGLRPTLMNAVEAATKKADEISKKFR